MYANTIALLRKTVNIARDRIFQGVNPAIGNPIHPFLAKAAHTHTRADTHTHTLKHVL